MALGNVYYQCSIHLIVQPPQAGPKGTGGGRRGCGGEPEAGTGASPAGPQKSHGGRWTEAARAQVV